MAQPITSSLSNTVTLETVQNLKNGLLVQFNSLAKDVDISEKKIRSLEELRGKISDVTASCEVVSQANEARLKGLVWWQRFLEVLAYYCYVSIGQYATTYFALQAVKTELVAKMTLFRNKEFENLARRNNDRSEKSLYFIHFYDRLAKLVPQKVLQDKRYLFGFADRLVIEGAYNAAVHTLQEYVGTYPDKEQSVKPLLVEAYKGAKRYQEAINTISSLSAQVQDSNIQHWLERKQAEIVLDQKLYREAKEAIRRLIQAFPHMEEFKRMLVFATLSDELQEGSKKPFFLACSKQLYGLKQTGEDVDLHAHFEFWVWVLLSERQAHNDQGVRKRIFEKIERLLTNQKVGQEAVFATLQHMVNKIQHEATSFQALFKQFINETATDLPIDAAIKQEIIEARLQSLKGRLEGITGVDGFSGIMPLCDTLTELCMHIEKIPPFTVEQNRSRLHTLKNTASSTKSILVDCWRLYATLKEAGVHPLLNTLQITFENPKLLPMGS